MITLLLLRLLANSLIIFLVSRMVRGIEIRGFGTAIAVTVVLGLVNALLRPVLLFLTFPITLLTLGLFFFVINALLFWLVSAIVPGFVIHGFLSALFGAFLVSLGGLLVSFFLPDPLSGGRN
ncbi:MAG: phage holin family protein [Leptospirales bacterium]